MNSCSKAVCFEFNKSSGAHKMRDKKRVKKMVEQKIGLISQARLIINFSIQL